MTRLDDLYNDFGQSPWIDNIRRDWLNDGTLEALVKSGVRGVTSNPSIFAKAFATSTAYDALVGTVHSRDPESVFEHLAINDVRDACDVLAGVHESSRTDFALGRRRYCDGFVSLEVSPRLARDASATIAAARDLFARVGRSNVMIKIPATVEGLVAITEVLSNGINVNVTLIFSLARYQAVLDAWTRGLEQAAKNGHDIGTIASVASFFVSRVDTAMDALLDEADPHRGMIANAQVAAAYEVYRLHVGREASGNLLKRGAQVQRPLWASTSTKNPAYDELLYVDSIVADETVNTMPDPTLRLALEKGDFSKSLLSDSTQRTQTAALLDTLPRGVSLDEVTEKLENDGVESFVQSHDELLETVASKLRALS